MKGVENLTADDFMGEPACGSILFLVNWSETL